MNPIRPGPGGWKTVRAAIRSWDETWRLVVIMGAATLYIAVVLIVMRLLMPTLR